MNRLLKVALLSCAGALAAMGAKAETIKIGVLTSYSGIAATGGPQVDGDIKLFLKKYGDTIGGRKIEFIKRDSTGPNPAVARPRMQELIFRDHVQILNGIDFTPNVLAYAPLLTKGKTPGIIIGAATSGTVAAKSPYYARTFMTLGQVSRPMAQWAAKNGIKKVYTVVADYAPGYEAEKSFIEEFKKDGGTIVGSVRVPIKSAEFSAYMQRVKDSGADAMFGFMPIGELSVGLVRAFHAAGLGQAGIKLIGTGDIVDEGSLPAEGDDALGVITSFIYSPTHKSKENQEFLKEFAALNPGVPVSISGIAFWDGMQLIKGGLEAQKDTKKFDPDKFMKWVAGRKLMSPRGPIQIDPKTHDIIQNVYIRKVEKVNGKLANVEFETIPHVMP
jgi:branched-chain amino acid transport system substrate-binding protein